MRQPLEVEYDYIFKTLQDALDAHRVWVESGGDKGSQFAPPFGYDLSKVNLRYINLSKARLMYANLSKSNLVRANLSYADLRYVNLSGADLSQANLNSSDLTGTKLIGASMYDAVLTGVNLALHETDFTNVDLTYVQAHPDLLLKIRASQQRCNHG